MGGNNLWLRQEMKREERNNNLWSFLFDTMRHKNDHKLHQLVKKGFVCNTQVMTNLMMNI